jgi:organic radical activating enzyme
MAEKQFAYFKPHVDEEKKKLVICSDLKEGNSVDAEPPYTDLCSKCRVFLMSDRFLGEEFHKIIGIGKNIYPYVMIANAVGCNLNCWFCYAYKLLERRDHDDQYPAYLSSQELAKCYLCKMQFAVNYIQDKREPLLSRIRITGGEPLAHVEDTFRGAEASYAATIDYYLDFFRHLNSGLNKLIESGAINIANADEIKNIREQRGRIDKPTWIALKPGRITIRFDTNGLIFGKEKDARRFLEGLFKLNQESKEQDKIYLEIDYSLKGATAIEYFWSQLKKNEERNEEEFEPQEQFDDPSPSSLDPVSISFLASPCGVMIPRAILLLPRCDRYGVAAYNRQTDKARIYTA